MPCLAKPLLAVLSLMLIAPVTLVTLVTLGACEARGESMPPPAKSEGEGPGPEQAPADPPEPVEASRLTARYAWLAALDPALEVVPLVERFSAPSGYTRVGLAADSFGAFLRHLPIRTDRTAVLSYAQKRLSSPSAGVVAMDVGDKNLQQCADTAIRLHAEYLWSQDRRDQLAYHFTSGDETRWTDWQSGERYEVSGARVERVRRGAVPKTHRSFRRWLDTVFMYAGTRSLRFDSRPVDTQAGQDAIAPGDFFVAPGSPGHAVVVLDVAEDAKGKRVALLGQGFMPAQELHVLRAPGSHTLDGVWFMLPEAGESLDTPSWRPFRRSQARRFVTGDDQQ